MFTSATEGDLLVTLAVWDLFLERLEIDADASLIGEQVWYRQYGGDRSG